MFERNEPDQVFRRYFLKINLNFSAEIFFVIKTHKEIKIDLKTPCYPRLLLNTFKPDCMKLNLIQLVNYY